LNSDSTKQPWNSIGNFWPTASNTNITIFAATLKQDGQLLVDVRFRFAGTKRTVLVPVAKVKGIAECRPHQPAVKGCGDSTMSAAI
jgi:hypothetical protein